MVYKLNEEGSGTTCAAVLVKEDLHRASLKIGCVREVKVRQDWYTRFGREYLVNKKTLNRPLTQAIMLNVKFLLN